MTNSRAVLELLMQGVGNVEALSAQSGLSPHDVREAIKTLRRTKRIEAFFPPIHYRVTSIGERALSVPPMPRKVLEHKKVLRQAREARALIMVDQAKSRQPMLAQVWGAAP